LEIDGRAKCTKHVQRLDTVKLWANSKPNAEKKLNDPALQKYVSDYTTELRHDGRHDM
jgi:hypothetical protein